MPTSRRPTALPPAHERRAGPRIEVGLAEREASWMRRPARHSTTMSARRRAACRPRAGVPHLRHLWRVGPVPLALVVRRAPQRRSQAAFQQPRAGRRHRERLQAMTPPKDSEAARRAQQPVRPPSECTPPGMEGSSAVALARPPVPSRTKRLRAMSPRWSLIGRAIRRVRLGSRSRQCLVHGQAADVPGLVRCRLEGIGDRV